MTILEIVMSTVAVVSLTLAIVANWRQGPSALVVVTPEAKIRTLMNQIAILQARITELERLLAEARNQ